MIIPLKDLLHSPRNVDVSFEPGWWEPCHGNDTVLGLKDPLTVQMTLSNDGRQYTVEGRLRGKVVLQCDRCLTEYVHPVQSEFRLLLAASENAFPGEIELSQEDMSVAFLTTDAIDIDHIVREQIYLALPMKHLCREACRGLCPVCGTNLNKGPCGCRKSKGHPAFQSLKHLTVTHD